jgi:multiple sugar transport system permease protein
MAAVSSVARTGRARRSSTRPRQGLIGWLFALPFTALFAVFMAGPILMSLALSFTDLRSADVRNPLGVNLVGIDNYVKLFHDQAFLQGALNTLIFVGVGVPLTMAAALAVAVGLNSGLIRFRSAFRVGYYLPVVTSIVAIAVVWRSLLEPGTGLINSLLRLVNVDGPNWLQNTALALPALIVMATWRNLGFLMVIFLAGLQAIPHDLYEAATIDGAGRWAQFRHVTVPQLRPTLLFGAVITGIGYLQVFEEPFVMTQGGPLGHTLTVSYHIYNQFGFGNYAYASAMGYVLFVAIVALSIVQFRLLRPKS